MYYHECIMGIVPRHDHFKKSIISIIEKGYFGCYIHDNHEEVSINEGITKMLLLLQYATWENDKFEKRFAFFDDYNYRKYDLPQYSHVFDCRYVPGVLLSDSTYQFGVHEYLREYGYDKEYTPPWIGTPEENRKKWSNVYHRASSKVTELEKFFIRNNLKPWEMVWIVEHDRKKIHFDGTFLITPNFNRVKDKRKLSDKIFKIIDKKRNGKTKLLFVKSINYRPTTSKSFDTYDPRDQYPKKMKVVNCLPRRRIIDEYRDFCELVRKMLFFCYIITCKNTSK